ncbi:anti-sigma regulatory factor [Bacteroidales bacterium]|nr:anti-sigma regulatory factor [Bacteroidales bacterium]
METVYNIEGGNFTKAGYASSEVKKALKKLNIDFKIIKRTVVALYEAEVNVVAHAHEGNINVEISSDQIRVVIKDNGPGIQNIDKAMQEGFSTASPKVREMGFGAGMGLPNIKRNSDTFNIKSEVGVGTELEIINKFD